jgi:GNAT superfamily N-acetyltransferase
LTSSHPYHDAAEVIHFLAEDSRGGIGRVSAAINHRYNDVHEAELGFFGFFDCSEDPGLATALLDAAASWLRSRGMTRMRGPGGYSNATHEPYQGVLINGFERPPTVELNHTPPYYASFLERYGLSKAKDYHAYWIDIDAAPLQRIGPLVERVRSRRRIRTRPVQLARIRREVDLIVEIYNESWAANWGFLPLTEAEAAAMASTLKLVADPGLMRFAYVDNELAAVLGALPDPYVAWRLRRHRPGNTDIARIARLLWMRRRIPLMRLMFFGIRPRHRKAGVDAVLYHEVLAYALERGYRGCEPSMLLEDNDLVLRAARSMGGHRDKTWRIYEMPI